MRRLFTVLALLAIFAADHLQAQQVGLYAPLQPCRLFDSRANDGLPLAAGGTISLLARGSCNVPLDAVGVAVTVVAFNPSANGHLKLWESSLPAPLSSSMNFRQGPGSSSSFLLPRLCYPAPECAVEDLSLYVSQGTHVIVDVVGYVAPVQ